MPTPYCYLNIWVNESLPQVVRNGLFCFAILQKNNERGYSFAEYP